MNINLVMFKSFLGVTAFLALLGCEDSENTQVICNKNPELCADLHKDSWCRYEKGDLIRNRNKLKDIPVPSGKEIFEQLIYLEDYNKCIELASGVQHILHPERTNDRIKAFGLSSQSLSELQETTKDSADPHLAFYHWSRFNDTNAEKILFKAEKDGMVTDLYLQAQLGAYFLKSEPQRAKTLYASALNQSTRQTFNPDWLLALATLYRSKNRPDMDYWLSKTNIELTHANYSEGQLTAIIKGDKKLQTKLDKDAKVLAEQLNSGNYKESELKIVL
ncbi:DUF2989 domain-containing protein, partial [Shewanella sairae]